MHSEKCSVCKGRGEISIFDNETGVRGKKQCHGCHNKGWIEVNDQSIQVQQDNDGILWLIVKSESGKCGMLNLNELENQLCREAFLEWGNSFANNHFQPDQNRAEQISML